MENKIPKPMTHRPSPPATSGVLPKVGDDEVVAERQVTGERQRKIERLRTIEDRYEHYDEDKPKKKHRVLHFFGWMLLIVLLTAAGAAAGWYFWLGKEPRQTPAATELNEKSTPPPAAVEKEAEPTETHSSTAYNMRFDFPETWKVVEGEDNRIVATSPAVDLKVAGGSATQKGQIVMIVQHRQSTLPEFKTGNALAVLESEKLTYARPSQTQRANTYLSFLSYDGSKVKGIDGLYITGDNGYVKDQYIPQADITKSDPLIMVSFRKCVDAKCSATSDGLTLAASSWENTEFVKPIKTLLQSIVVE